LTSKVRELMHHPHSDKYYYSSSDCGLNAHTDKGIIHTDKGIGIAITDF